MQHNRQRRLYNRSSKNATNDFGLHSILIRTDRPVQKPCVTFSAENRVDTTVFSTEISTLGFLLLKAQIQGKVLKSELSVTIIREQ